jgi:hypothetical protein
MDSFASCASFLFVLLGRTEYPIRALDAKEFLPAIRILHDDMFPVFRAVFPAKVALNDFKFHFAPPVSFLANIAMPISRRIAAINGTETGHTNADATNSKNVSGCVGSSQLQRATAKLAAKKVSRNITVYTMGTITLRLLPVLVL